MNANCCNNRRSNWMIKPRRCRLSSWLKSIARGAHLTLQMLVLGSRRGTTRVHLTIRMDAAKSKHRTIRCILPTSSFWRHSLCLSKEWLRKASRTSKNTTTRSPFNCIPIRIAILKQRRLFRKFRMLLVKLTRSETWEVITVPLTVSQTATSSSSQTNSILATINNKDSDHGNLCCSYVWFLFSRRYSFFIRMISES